MSGVSNSFRNEIAGLKKLKKLNVWANKTSDLKEVGLISFRIKTTLLTSSQIVRSCRQVEILRMNVYCLVLRDLTELEPADVPNMTEVSRRDYDEILKR